MTEPTHEPLNKNERALFVVRKEMYFLKPFTVSVERHETITRVTYAHPIRVRMGEEWQIVECPVLKCELNLSLLSKRVDWKDCTQYGWHLKQYDVDYMLSVARLMDQYAADGMEIDDIINGVTAAYPRYGTVNRNGYFINISAYLQNGRVTSMEGHGQIPAYRMLNFTIKFKDSKFDEIMMSLNIDSMCVFHLREEIEDANGVVTDKVNKVVEVINSMEIYRHLRKIDPVIRDLVWRPRIRMCVNDVDVDTSLNFLNGIVADRRDNYIKLDDLRLKFDEEKLKFLWKEFVAELIRTHLLDVNGSQSLYNIEELDPRTVFFVRKSKIRSEDGVVVSVELEREWTSEKVYRDADVYLEHVNGHLVHNRVHMTKDKYAFGSYFRVMGPGMDGCEYIKVKAGFRYQNGLNDLYLVIIDDSNYLTKTLWGHLRDLYKRKYAQSVLECLKEEVTA